jgi:hypothetical protein
MVIAAPAEVVVPKVLGRIEEPAGKTLISIKA